jgi:hypothetical protein
MTDKKKDSASELSVANVGGIFVVLVFGLIVAFIVAILEFFWIAKKPSNDQVNFYSHTHNAFSLYRINKFLF